jgi:hypothetical protein
MPKACQTGWFKPSRYRFNFLTGTEVGVWLSEAKPASLRGMPEPGKEDTGVKGLSAGLVKDSLQGKKTRMS